jgi:predicted enzyme related to lactoylglutathione lyase
MVADMTTTLRNVTFDCSDARKVADFWSALTGWNVYYDDDPEVVVAPHFPPDGLTLLFVPVPEDKTVKNRVHLDLQPSDCSRDEQVTRALDLGATVVADHREDDGSGWVTMADPEGNEFCIERSQAERPVAPRVFRIEG